MVEKEEGKNQGKCPSVNEGKSLPSYTDASLHHTIWDSVGSQVFADLRIAIVSRFIISTRSVRHTQHHMASHRLRAFSIVGNHNLVGVGSSWTG
jgi:hypothetical protein